MSRDKAKHNARMRIYMRDYRDRKKLEALETLVKLLEETKNE